MGWFIPLRSQVKIVEKFRRYIFGKYGIGIIGEEVDCAGPGI